MYLVIRHKSPLAFSYIQSRFENKIQLNDLITTNIKSLSFVDNYVGDIRFIKYIIVLQYLQYLTPLKKLNIS
jgi:hypothetical protein